MKGKIENDVIKGKVAEANVYAYSREALEGLLTNVCALFGSLAPMILLAYIGSEDDPLRDRVLVQMVIIFFIAIVLYLIYVHYMDLMMFIDIRRGDVDEKVVRFVYLNGEYRETKRRGKSRVEKYFTNDPSVGKYIIKCTCRDAKKFRIRTILSCEKWDIVSRRFIKNEASVEVKIKYLRRSKLLLSFEEIYSDAMTEKERKNLCYLLNSKI